MQVSCEGKPALRRNTCHQDGQCFVELFDYPVTVNHPFV